MQANEIYDNFTQLTSTEKKKMRVAPMRQDGGLLVIHIFRGECVFNSLSNLYSFFIRLLADLFVFKVARPWNWHSFI